MREQNHLVEPDIEVSCEDANGHGNKISLFHLAFQFTIYNGPTNALVCNKTLIQMSHAKTLKITQHVSIIR
jgi:hypothetical protein